VALSPAWETADKYVFRLFVERLRSARPKSLRVYTTGGRRGKRLLGGKMTVTVTSQENCGLFKKTVPVTKVPIAVVIFV
jgi:hypothetical protein